MPSSTSQRPARPYEQAGLLLGGLGIVTALVMAWYVGAFLTLASAGVLVTSIWVRHQPMTRWTRAATVLVVAGIVVELAVALLFTPITPVRAG